MPDDFWVQFHSGGPWHAARSHWRDSTLFATCCKPSWNYRVSAVTVSQEPGPRFCAQPNCTVAGNAYRRNREDARRAAAAESA